MNAQELIDKIREVQRDTLQELEGCPDLSGVREIKIRALGKKGPLTNLMKSMGKLSGEDRPTVGAAFNQARTELEQALDGAIAQHEAEAEAQRLASERIDVTLAGRGRKRANRHPIAQVESELIAIFAELGFQIANGPEVEDDRHNFEALNFPPDHPARDMQDTFFIEGPTPRVLRTHTSPVQIRVMEAYAPPIRCIMPGRVYRCDSDITHSPVFHQIEGLYLEKDRPVTFGHLKGTLEYFLKRLYGEEAKIRLRPSFFPFTEPSAEADVSCVFCEGGGAECRVCGSTGWIEVLGAGMVDPNVLESVGYDPQQVSGFAFGVGVERVAMLRYGINDIRLLFENDIRFLSQFR